MGGGVEFSLSPFSLLTSLHPWIYLFTFCVCVCLCVCVCVCVCVCACVCFLGLPRSLASIQRKIKETSKKKNKELMLRNIHMNTIFLCLGVSGGLCTCCFSWKSRPWFWSLNCSSSLTTRAKLKSRLTDFSWPCCFYQKPAGSRLRHVHFAYIIHTASHKRLSIQFNYQLYFVKEHS